MRGLGRGDEEAKELLEEPVPTAVGRRRCRSGREGSDEASDAVGSGGSAGEGEERRESVAEGFEEEAAAAASSS